MKALSLHKYRPLWKWFPLFLTMLVIGLMAWLIWKEWDLVTSFPWNIKPGYILLVFFFHSLALGATFVVWHLMIYRLSGFNNIPINLRFYYTTTLAKRIPTSIPYIGSRLVLYRQMNVSGATIMNCIVLENLLIGTAGLLTFLVFLPFYSKIPEGISYFIALLAIALVLLLYLRPRIFIDLTNWILDKLGKSHLEVKLTRRDIFVWIGLYIFPWLFAGLSFYYAPLAFSDFTGLKLIDALEISTLATLVSLLNFFLPGGLSLKELTSSTLLSAWIPFAAALVISLGYRLLHTVNEIFWAVLTLFIPVPKELPANSNPESANNFPNSSR